MVVVDDGECSMFTSFYALGIYAHKIPKPIHSFIVFLKSIWMHDVHAEKNEEENRRWKKQLIIERSKVALFSWVVSIWSPKFNAFFYYATF